MLSLTMPHRRCHWFALRLPMSPVSRLPRIPPLLAIYLFFGWFSIVPQLVFYSTDITGWSGLRDAILYTCTWFLIPALAPPVVLPRLLIVLGSIMGFCALTKLGNFMVFGQELSQSVFVATLETTPAEATEFFHQYVKGWMFLVGLLYLLPVAWFYQQAKHARPNQRQRLTLLAVTCLFLFQPFISQDNTEKALKRLTNRFETVEPWSMALNYVAYRENLQEAERMAEHMTDVMRNAVVTAHDTTAQQTYVLVIGESTARERLSLYGHARQTNPQLSAIKNELLLYTDVAAVIPYTIESLSTTLSLADPENLKEVFHKMNIITLMRKVGFKSFWITNQQTLTKRNTLLSALSDLTDEQTYLNNNRRQNSASYDDAVLAPFIAALKDPSPKKLIVVHLLGTHFNYLYRYPESATVFHGQPVPSRFATTTEQMEHYNHYDNAVLFNDGVVRSLIEAYRATDPYGFLLYFSDHGEEVFDNIPWNGRSMSNPTPNMYDIPFMLWPSPKWSATRDIAALRATVGRPASQRDFLHGWCDLVRIDFIECQPSRSVFSATYRPTERWIGVSSNRWRYDEIKARYPSPQR